LPIADCQLPIADWQRDCDLYGWPLNPKTGVGRDLDKPIANPRLVGRVTPCAPRLQPARTGFSQALIANPVVPNHVP
jgi:hypothetical protein